MAGIVYELMDVLDAQVECYEGLNTLAKYKEQAIVEKNLQLLEEVTGTEEQFVGRLGVLDKKREVLMKDIAMVTGMNSKEVTLTTIAAKLSAQEEVSSKLTSLRDKIKSELTTLKSLEFVDFMINAIGSTKGYVHVGNYGKPGADQMVERQQSVFDHKQ